MATAATAKLSKIQQQCQQQPIKQSTSGNGNGSDSTVASVVEEWCSEQQRGDGIQQEQWQHHQQNSSGSIIEKGTVAKLQTKNLSKKATTNQ